VLAARRRVRAHQRESGGGFQHAVHDLVGLRAIQPTDVAERVQRQRPAEDALVELHGASRVAVKGDVGVETRETICAP
jgi:hypothetical protein